MKSDPGAISGVAARYLLALVAVLMAAAGCATGDLVRVSDMAVVEPASITVELAHADMVFVGEHHDDRLHHRKQLLVIRSLKEAGVDVAVGLEMYMAQNQEQLDRWVEGTVPEREMKRLFAKNWGIPWSKYKEIFRYARDERIPLVGLNISKKVIHQIFKDGFGSLTPEQLAVMPGARCDVDDRYAAFIREAMGRHDHGKDKKDEGAASEDGGSGADGAVTEDAVDEDAGTAGYEEADEVALDATGDGISEGADVEVSGTSEADGMDEALLDATGDGIVEGADVEAPDTTEADGTDEESFEDRMFRKFCEAQAAWDATMAFRAVEYLDEHPGRTLVVLAGSAHAWKRGIPRLVRARSGYTMRVIIPESSEQLSIKEVTLDDSDYLWLDPW